MQHEHKYKSHSYTEHWVKVSLARAEMAIKAFSSNVPPSKAASNLIFPSKTSGLATWDYEDDDFEEVSMGRLLVGTEDVLDVDEVLKCREGIPEWEATPTENNSHAADGSPSPRVHTAVKH